MKFRDHPLMTWLPGPGLAIAGAAAVRWLAPGFTGRTQAIVLVVGYLVIPLGLYLFAARLGRRAAQRAAADSASVPRA
jgi:hypothetical protein